MGTIFRIAAAIFLCSVAFAQNAPESDIAQASKSPFQLARYFESHRVIDWDALWNGLGTRDPEIPYPPCWSSQSGPCSTQVVTILNPDQAMLIVQGFNNDIYLRFLQKGNGNWQFAGERRAFVKEYDRRHEVTRLGGKPFLKISSDHSQVGGALMQEVEDWFDLTQPTFDPVFSFTPQGSLEPFSFAVGRTIRAHCNYHRTQGLETIDLILEVHFNGPGFDIPATYFGVYERRSGESKFPIRHAYSGLRRTAIPIKDFVELAGFDTGLPNERLVVYALSGLQKIASGSDKDARQWLTFVLDHVGDIPEKRTLLELIAKHYRSSSSTSIASGAKTLRTSAGYFT